MTEDSVEMMVYVALPGTTPKGEVERVMKILTREGPNGLSHRFNLSICVEILKATYTHEETFPSSLPELLEATKTFYRRGWQEEEVDYSSVPLDYQEVMGFFYDLGEKVSGTPEVEFSMAESYLQTELGKLESILG